MTTYVAGPADSGDAAGPADLAAPIDDPTWWDRHGWDGVSPSPAAASLAPGDGPDPTAAANDGPRWSTMLTAVAVVGGLLTLPVLGFAGGFGRILAPTVWAFVGLAVGLRLSDREPAWDLRDARRVEPLVGWLLAYAGTAVMGLRWFEGVEGWWVPGTVLTALMPFAVARARPATAGRGRSVGSAPPAAPTEPDRLSRTD